MRLPLFTILLIGLSFSRALMPGKYQVKIVKTRPVKTQFKPVQKADLAVYRTFLKWLRSKGRDGAITTIYLSFALTSLDEMGKQCSRKFVLQWPNNSIQYLFLPGMFGKHIHLVNPNFGEKYEHDIAFGKKIHASDSKSPGFLTFSPVIYNAQQSIAIIDFDFFCGNECADHGRMIFKKYRGEWKIWKSCGYIIVS